MKELLYGFYGTRLYLPFSGASRAWRRFVKRSVHGPLPVRLPPVSWKQCSDQRMVRIWEPEKVNGNVRLSELGILNALASGCESGTNLFEIGTFDGRTTLNLALASPTDCEVYTLDLPSDVKPRFLLAPGEESLVKKQKSGSRFLNTGGAILQKIHQMHGDSATFDFSPWYQSCSLVFVDGSHSYQATMNDTVSAMRMVRVGGSIVWHDYGIWPGVTDALDELEEKKKFGLKNIKGTSLCIWKNE